MIKVPANGLRRALSRANSIARGEHRKWTQSRRTWNQWGQLTSVRLAQLSRQCVPYIKLASCKGPWYRVTGCIYESRSSTTGRAPLPRNQCSCLAPPHNGCSLHEVDSPSRAASDDVPSNPPHFPSHCFHCTAVAPARLFGPTRIKVSSFRLWGHTLGWTARCFANLPCTLEKR